MHKLKLINSHLKGYKLMLLFVIIATILFSFLNLFQNLVFSYVIDNVVDGVAITNPLLILLTSLLGGMDYIRDHLFLVAIFLIIIYLISALLMYYRYTKQAVVAETLAENLRNHLYHHIELLPYKYLIKVKTGDLVQRCTSDVNTIWRFFSGQIEEIFAIVSSVSIALIILVGLDSKLAIFASISFPIIFLYSYFYFKKMQKLFLSCDEKESELTTFIQESLTGVRVIKAFNRERYELNRFLKESKEYEDTSFKMIAQMGVNWGLSYGICTLGILSVVVAGIFAVRNGNLTPGNFFIFITYQSKVLYQIRALGRILSDFGKVSVSIDRIDEILSEEIEDLEEGDKPDLNGDIVFENVSFAYEDDKDALVLDDISFTIKKGSTLALLGPTGSGKSSLIHLLVRLYEPTSGRITINGHDIKTIAKGYLRKNVGIVLQEPFLFSKSIYDNLSIASPYSDRIDIYNASKVAAVHDVITGFEKGYDTLVGEKGVTLSGGQKQRIAIARTIVNHSSILVFDDSLSAVDTETDASIRKALKNFDKDATMIIITQRIISAKDADNIIIIENGKISEEGSHEQLVNNHGLYARINDIQLQMKGVDNG